MARSNYNFKKRQKEIKRMKKQEAKRLRKMGQTDIDTEENPDQPQSDQPQPDQPQNDEENPLE